MKTQRKGPFLGINNRLPATALHVDKVGDFLADAENIDIDNAGQLRRRQAAALIHPLAAPHSLYMTSDTAGFMVMASELYAVTLPTYSATSIKALTSNAAMSYAEIGGVLFYSNGTDSGRIVGGVALPMAFPTPDAPTVAGGIGGDLPAGKYRVAVAYCNPVTGEEGGVSPSQTIATIATGGLRITLPPTTTGATNANVYLTTLNGSVLMLSTSVVLGLWPTVDVIAEASGRPAMQRHEKPLPAGRMFAFQGALCSFKGNEVYEGLPHRHGYCRQLGSRIPFVGDVSNVVPTENGVYVVADETFWLAGPVMTEAEKVSPIMPYGGVPGTAFTFPDDTKRVGWFGADGVVIADKLGQAKSVMADAIDLVAPGFGVSAVFASGGYLRVVSCGWCLNLESNAATRYAGFDFTSISGEYATKADGIYATEAAGKVDAFANLGKESFDSEQKKSLPAIYLGVASTAPLAVTVTLPDGTEYDYEARSYSETLDMHRVDPGKGLRETWFGLIIKNTDGGDFTLASQSFAPIASTRRI